jgi:hypothetical protein
MKELILSGKICPYCSSDTEFVDSKIVYGRSYGMIYICRPCDAYVGVHEGTSQALGRLANKELREAKKKAHLSFDQIWKNKIKSRSGSYAWLSEQLGIPAQETHIGMFDVETCKRVVALSRNLIEQKKGYNPSNIGEI